MRHLALIVLAAFAAACSEPAKSPKAVAHAPAKHRADGSVADDHSLCDFRNRKDVEVSETAGPGATFTNIRRVWKVFGTGADRRKVLICREVDTNLDGFKDVARYYGDDGQSKLEVADTNFDGRIDTWVFFAKGRLSEVWLDKNYDGKVDEKKYYADGKLSRVKRDAKFAGVCKPSAPPCPATVQCDCKFDTWEIYSKGRLERIGVDLDGDERVDRWDHDTEWSRKIAAAEEKRQEEEAKKKQEESDRRIKEAEEAAAKNGDDKAADKPEAKGKPDKKQP